MHTSGHLIRSGEAESSVRGHAPACVNKESLGKKHTLLEAYPAHRVTSSTLQSRPSGLPPSDDFVFYSCLFILPSTTYDLRGVTSLRLWRGL